MMKQPDFDVIIIGAGVAGAITARELSKFALRIAIVEKHADICFSTTKASHGIVHCCFPVEGSPLKNRGEKEGNRTMGDLCAKLEVPFRRIGKLLVAFSEEEVNVLRGWQRRAAEFGVEGWELIDDRGRLEEMEPHLAGAVKAALYTPTTGIVNPWSLVIGLVENAVANGCELRLNSEVKRIEPWQESGFRLHLEGEALTTDWVINAGGQYADRLARMIGDDSFSLKLLRQERIISDKPPDFEFNHLVRTLSNGGPTGHFVSPTIDDNIMIGSWVEPTEEAEASHTSAKGLFDIVIPQARRLIENLPLESIRPFAGAIPVAGGDFHIQSAPGHPRFINFVLGASGLTGSVAMRRYLVEELMPPLGFSGQRRPDFNPRRQDIPHFNSLTNDDRAKLIAERPSFGKIVCRCETVSEGEIVEALRRGAATRDGVKFRTRAGMGRCQANFCGHKVLSIMARELGKDPGAVTRKGGRSFELDSEDPVVKG
jgi:glycerol-3-phosphate dehydrogenase